GADDFRLSILAYHGVTSTHGTETSERHAPYQAAVVRICKRFNMLPQYDEGMQNPGIARFGYRHEVSGRIDQPNASHVIGRARRPADMGWSDLVAMRRTSKALLGQLDPGHLGNQRVRRDQRLGAGSVDAIQRQRVRETEASGARAPQRFEMRAAAELLSQIVR